MLRSGCSSEMILRDLSARHFAGPLDLAAEEELRQANASPALLDALKNPNIAASEEELAQVRKRIADEKVAAQRAAEQEAAVAAQQAAAEEAVARPGNDTLINEARALTRARAALEESFSRASALANPDVKTRREVLEQAKQYEIAANQYDRDCARAAGQDAAHTNAANAEKNAWVIAQQIIQWSNAIGSRERAAAAEEAEAAAYYADNENYNTLKQSVEQAQFFRKPASAIDTFGIHSSHSSSESFKLDDLQRQVEDAQFLREPASAIHPFP